MPPTKPPFAYYGGKTRIAGRIAELLPEHLHYVEPFAGGLSVLLAKTPSRMETVNDLDGDLMCFWRVLRERPDDLVRVCALTPHSRAEHEAAYGDLTELDEVERARRVWVRLSQGRAGTLKRTGWRHFVDAAASRGSMPGNLAGYLDRMLTAAARLHEVSLECRPALEVVGAYGRHRSTLLYVDPPYLGNTRTRNYRTEMMGEGAHRELATVLRSCRSTVVLSGYASGLYTDLYGDWYRTDLEAFTTQGTGDQARTEVLWSNRPLNRVEPEIATLWDINHETPWDINQETPEIRNDASPTCNETPVRCGAPECGLVVEQPTTGRRRRYCSDACRVRAHRARRAA